MSSSSCFARCLTTRSTGRAGTGLLLGVRQRGAPVTLIVRPHQPEHVTMKRLGIGLLCAVGGYIVAALVGYLLIGQFSSNGHDRSVEAAMTSAFVLGPLG